MAYADSTVNQMLIMGKKMGLVVLNTKHTKVPVPSQDAEQTFLT